MKVLISPRLSVIYSLVAFCKAGSGARGGAAPTQSAVTAKKFGDSAFCSKPNARKRAKTTTSQHIQDGTEGNTKVESTVLRECLDAGMAPRMDDIMRLCCEISAHDEIKVTVKNSAKGAMVAAGGAFVGGMLAGPPGLAVGGTVGSLVSWLTSEQFRPLPQILMELPPAQRQQLYDQVAAVLNNLDWTDAAQLIALVMGNATLQQQVTAALLNYVTKELRSEVRYKD